MTGPIIKTSRETWPLAFEFADRLPTGATIESGTVSAVEVRTLVQDNSVLADTTAVIDGTQAKVSLQGGVDGKAYKIRCIVTLDSSHVLEESAELKIQD